MADDPNLVAIFYGPTLLAFETSAELMLKSSPAEILKNLSRVGDTFQLVDKSQKYTLRPFFSIEK